MLKMKNKSYWLAILAATVISSTTNADFSDWYKKDTPNNVPVQQQQPTQVQQQQPGQIQQQPTSNTYNQNQNNVSRNSNIAAGRIQNSSSSVSADSGLEGRMNSLNATIDTLNKSSKSGDKLTNNYLNIVQFIVINDETRKLDGKDNTALINNMLAGIVSCQNKYKVDVIQKVNNQLPRDAANTVQRYLSQNGRLIPSNSDCMY